MESGPLLVGPDIQTVIDRMTSGLGHAREAYYEEFRAIILKQARLAVETGDPQEAVAHANESLAALSRLAFRREHDGY